MNNIKKLVVIFAVVFSFASAVYGARGDLSSNISSIDIKGNNSISIDKILEVILSRVGDTLSENKTETDIKAIYSMGFFKDVSVTFEKNKDGTKIIYHVQENPVIKNIIFEGNTAYKQEKLLGLISSRAGGILSYKALQEDIRLIDDQYHKDGYILEKILDVSTDTKEAVIKIKIAEGMIEGVEISGNDITKDYVILREMQSKSKTVLNEKKLSKDLKRLFNLGFFSEINPNFEPGSSPDQVILIINVKESKTNTINFGGGYGEREGWFGFIDLSAENLFGTGHSTLLRGQAGQLQSTYQFRYTYPWFLPDKLGDRVSATARRWLTQGKNIYLLDTSENQGLYNGWDVTFSKPISDEWNTILTLGSEKADPTSTATFEPYNSNTIGLSFSYDTRDNWMNPSYGQYYVLGIRQGWKITSTSATDFQKYSADINQFIKIADRQTLAGHLGLGIGLRDVPIGEIFYVGGTNTVRGYEPSESSSQNGKRRLLANVEYRYSFNEMFQGVLFFDWGGAWDDGWPKPDSFISGKGFGIRFNTPMGPIRLDYGIGANRAFSQGAVHFSIGQAF